MHFIIDSNYVSVFAASLDLLQEKLRGFWAGDETIAPHSSVWVTPSYLEAATPCSYLYNLLQGQEGVGGGGKMQDIRKARKRGMDFNGRGTFPLL